MVQVVCQRCGATQESERLNIAHFEMKHEKGCGAGIGILKVSSKATAKAIPPEEVTTATTEVIMATTESTEEPKPKKSKRKKKSE